MSLITWLYLTSLYFTVKYCKVNTVKLLLKASSLVGSDLINYGLILVKPMLDNMETQYILLYCKIRKPFLNLVFQQIELKIDPTLLKSYSKSAVLVQLTPYIVITRIDYFIMLFFTILYFTSLIELCPTPSRMGIQITLAGKTNQIREYPWLRMKSSR